MDHRTKSVLKFTKNFTFRISSVNVTKPEVADLVTFNEEILNGTLQFLCSGYCESYYCKSQERLKVS